MCGNDDHQIINNDSPHTHVDENVESGLGQGRTNAFVSMGWTNNYGEVAQGSIVSFFCDDGPNGLSMMSGHDGSWADDWENHEPYTHLLFHFRNEPSMLLHAPRSSVIVADSTLHSIQKDQISRIRIDQ